MRELIKALLADKAPGAIVNISSVSRSARYS
jgi:hypothetical protein